MRSVIEGGYSQKEVLSQHLAGNFSCCLNRFEHGLLVENRLAKLYEMDIACLELYRASEGVGRACHGACYFTNKSLYENLLIKPLTERDKRGHFWTISSIACYIGNTQALLEFALHYLQEVSQFGAPGINTLLEKSECYRDFCLLKDANKLENTRNIVTDYCAKLDAKSAVAGDIYELALPLEQTLHQINKSIVNTLMNAGFKLEYW